MPRTEIPEDKDPTYERMPFTEVIVLPKDAGGCVCLLTDTGDGLHSVYGDRARWERIIAAVRASLDEPDAAG